MAFSLLTRRRIGEGGQRTFLRRDDVPNRVLVRLYAASGEWPPVEVGELSLGTKNFLFMVTLLRVLGGGDGNWEELKRRGVPQETIGIFQEIVEQRVWTINREAEIEGRNR